MLTEISEFLLVADKTSIKMVSLDVEALLPTQIPIAGSHQFNAVEYDPVKDEVYWIDAANGTILKVSRKVSMHVEWRRGGRISYTTVPFSSYSAVHTHTHAHAHTHRYTQMHAKMYTHTYIAC